MYSNSITLQFKYRQRKKDWDRVEWIEHLRPHLYLSAVGQFSDASRQFVLIMRRLNCKVVFSAVNDFFEAVVDGADYRKVFVAVAVASEFFMAVNRDITFHSGVPCSTVMDALLMRRMLVMCGLCFWASVISLLNELEDDNCRYLSLFFHWLRRRFEWSFDNLLRGTLSSLESKPLSRNSLSKLHVIIVSFGYFEAKEVLYFPASIAVFVYA